MGTIRRRAVVAAALGLIGFAALGVTARVTHVQADANTGAALKALLYLQSQQSATDGSLAGGYSVNDLYVLGAAAGGYDPRLLKHGGPSVVDYLTTNAASACPASTDTSPSAGNCGELIQAALAAGANPRSFGGLDLVARLVAYFDPATGRYGDGQAFTQALAIQGLVAAGESVPAAALTFLRTAEDSDGGWDFQDVHDDPNAATNFDTSDSNSTAMVLMALDAAGDHSRDTAALGWLHPLQNTDGGFSFQGGGSDPDSTALVLQAILATGASPTSPAWTVSGRTPAAELVATQDAGGGYTFPGNSGPDTFTTSQVPPALDGTAFPIPAASSLYVQGTPLPGSPPPAASPTPTSSVAAGVVTPPPALGSGPSAVSTPSTGAVGGDGVPAGLAYALLAVGVAMLAGELALVVCRR